LQWVVLVQTQLRRLVLPLEQMLGAGAVSAHPSVRQAASMAIQTLQGADHHVQVRPLPRAYHTDAKDTAGALAKMDICPCAHVPQPLPYVRVRRFLALTRLVWMQRRLGLQAAQRGSTTSGWSVPPSLRQARWAASLTWAWAGAGRARRGGRGP
jgi:hypothetical protein